MKTIDSSTDITPDTFEGRLESPFLHEVEEEDTQDWEAQLGVLEAENPFRHAFDYPEQTMPESVVQEWTEAEHHQDAETDDDYEEVQAESEGQEYSAEFYQDDEVPYGDPGSFADEAVSFENEEAYEDEWNKAEEEDAAGMSDEAEADEPDYADEEWLVQTEESPEYVSGTSDDSETTDTALEDLMVSETFPAAKVVFLSGESLNIVTNQPTGKDEAFWDPTNSGNPLLDTGAAQKNKKLSASFTVRELTTSGGVSADYARIDPKLVECLQKLRDYLGKPITITSGYRSWQRNKQVYEARSKTPTLSQHCGGRAVDIKIRGMSGLQIARAAIDACGPNIGIGLGNAFAHIDVRGCAAVWKYEKVPTSWQDEIKRYQQGKGARFCRSPRRRVSGTATVSKPATELTRFVQKILNITEGERLGVDGDFGSLTRAALERFRSRYRLGSGSNLDDKTQLALVQRALEEIAQQSLFTKGQLDAQTEQALIRFKAQRGLGSDASADAKTRAALIQVIEQRPVSGGRGLTAGTAQNAALIAKRELELWGNGTKKETDAEMRPLLLKYWRSVRDEKAANKAIDARTAWSAAFVSWVIKESNAGNAFAYSALHAAYVTSAKQARIAQDTTKYWAYKITEVKPEPGDIVVNDRCSGTNYDNVGDRDKNNWLFRKSHGDIVVDFDAVKNRIAVIGGNVSDSVKLKWIKLDQRGYLPQLTSSECPYFAVLKPPGKIV